MAHSRAYCEWGEPSTPTMTPDIAPPSIPTFSFQSSPARPPIVSAEGPGGAGHKARPPEVQVPHVGEGNQPKVRGPDHGAARCRVSRAMTRPPTMDAASRSHRAGRPASTFLVRS